MVAPRVDPDAVGQFTESIARFFGTGRYLLLQTLLVVAWIILNVSAVSLRWDPYPFILLNLAFSTQAAYAAPLILLAQNRQENRDRVALDEDRRRAEETKADTEYLARELAALRLAIGDVAKTRDYLRRELEDLRGLLEDRQLDKTNQVQSGSGGKRTARREVALTRFSVRVFTGSASANVVTVITPVMYGDVGHEAHVVSRAQITRNRGRLSARRGTLGCTHGPGKDAAAADPRAPSPEDARRRHKCR